jgi:GNAT superfamily N-acetyltransferase
MTRIARVTGILITTIAVPPMTTSIGWRGSPSSVHAIPAAAPATVEDVARSAASRHVASRALLPIATADRPDPPRKAAEAVRREAEAMVPYPWHMPIRIREGEPGDAAAIARIHVRSWQAAYRGQLTDDYLDGLNVEDRLEQHRRSLEEPMHEWRTWVAEDEVGLAGFAVTGPSQDADADPKTGEVYAIYLEPDHVGTGVGRELFAHAVDDLRDRGFRTVTLWVLETNERTRRFYEIAGWKPDGTATSERVDCEMRPTIRYRVEL